MSFPHFKTIQVAILTASALPSPVSAQRAYQELRGPEGSLTFGTSVTVLANGNLVVTDPGYGPGFPGAVYLYDGATLMLISVLTGSSYGDMAGEGGVVALSNGNFVISSPYWNGRRGAVTWGSGTLGTPAVISAENSLVGTSEGERVGSQSGILALRNGNYVVASPEWNSRRGAATWGDGASGVKGQISAANSLVGTRPGDAVGSNIHSPESGGGVVELANGNYVVVSTSWNGQRGAVTWASGSAGAAGEISLSNSLSGDLAGVKFGTDECVIPLANGNYLVANPAWNQWRGAVTWCDGATGRSGKATAGNSLVGGSAMDSVGIRKSITTLPNGNYIVVSSGFNWEGGAITWGNGASGLSGVVSKSNSLIGIRRDSSISDKIGSGGVTVLTNGNCVVYSPQWQHSMGEGAVTLINSSTGLTGEISEFNSLVGVWPQSFPTVIALANGNYVVSNSNWFNGVGAVTWGNGTTGITGAVSTDNSLTGEAYKIGIGRVTALTSGHYVVDLNFGRGEGSAAWVDGTGPAPAKISRADSLTGLMGPLYDRYRYEQTVIPLANGNYLVYSPWWNDRRGALTWGSGAGGTVGLVSAANSLIGTEIDHPIGEGGIFPLANGAYTVSTPGWNESRGAVTWGSSTAGVAGLISETNSLFGANAGDYAGHSFGGRSVVSLSDGNYAVRSTSYNASRGAVTVGDSELGTIGPISSANSYISAASFSQPLPGDESRFDTHYDSKGNRLIVGDRAANLVALIPVVRGIRVAGRNGADVLDTSLPATERLTAFGPVPVDGGIASHTFNISSTGMLGLALTGSPQVTIEGEHAGDFTVTAQPDSVLRNQASSSFEIAFNPSARGLRTAAVSIPNNTPDHHPFRFSIQGTGEGSYANWREALFGAAAVATAPLDDFDADGIPNLLEFAFGTNPAGEAGADGETAPLQYSGPLTGGSGTLISRGGPATFTENRFAAALWIRRKDHTAAAGLAYTPQFSADLQTWRTSASTPTLLAEDSEHQVLSLPYPETENGVKTRFFRLAVTLEP